LRDPGGRTILGWIFKKWDVGAVSFSRRTLLHGVSNTSIMVIKSRRMRWVGHVARMTEKRGVYRDLVEKPEGKRPPERPRRRWEDNIKTDLQKSGMLGYGLDRAGSG
jgi:hypothetical protein